MLEIFIPCKINNSLEINKFDNSINEIIKKYFPNLELVEFESKFVNWIYLKLNKIDKDLIILLNWYFWEFYFINYDFLINNIESTGIPIIKSNIIWEKIENICSTFENIISELKSNKLLTNSKKQKIRNKIDNVFFILSGIIFLLYNLKEKTQNNINTLNSYNWEVEYEWQSSLLAETSLTKKIELQAIIDKLEWKIDLFLMTINNIFIK